MRTARLLLALALVAAIALPAATAAANDGSVGTQGHSVRPIDNTQIRMDSESVQILCMRDYAIYRIDFKFVNETSEPQTVKLGFPFPDYNNTEEDNTGEPPGAFQAWLNGDELAVTEEKGFDTDEEGNKWDVVWFTHTATFEPGESMITVSYIGAPDMSVAVESQLAGVEMPADVKPTEDGFLPVTMGYYPYIVHTGAGWKGTIGKSVIRYALSDEFNGFGMDKVISNVANQEWISAARAGNMTAYTKPEPNIYEWVYTDYEPTLDNDVELAFVQRSEWSETFDPWEATKGSSYLKLGEYEYPPYSIRNGYPGDAWAEGAKGSGVGEWVKIPWEQARDVAEIRVLPGYQKRADLFAKYNRPSRLKVEFSNGESTELELEDRMGLQVFPVKAAGAEWAKVTILDVYKGTNDRDETYISEIDFGTSSMPKFKTFKAVTGIDAPGGFQEPAALAPMTEASGEGENGGGIGLGGSGVAGALGEKLGTGGPGWLPWAIIGGFCCCGLVLVGAIVLVVVLVRKRKAGAAAAAPPAPPTTPGPPAG